MLNENVNRWRGKTTGPIGSAGIRQVQQRSIVAFEQHWYVKTSVTVTAHRRPNPQLRFLSSLGRSSVH